MTRSAPLLLLLAALLFFFALGNHELQGSTEARVAGIAMAMHLDNDWVVPRLFREPFLEKPPLSLWLDAGAIRLFGGTTWAVRLASAFAGLVGAPFSGLVLEHLDGVLQMRGWHWLFLLGGLPCVGLGFLVLKLLKDRIEDAHWLTPSEKTLLASRIAVHEPHKSGGSLLAALRIPGFLMLGFIYFLIQVASYGLNFWAPQLIRSAGTQSPVMIGLLTAIPYVCGAISMVVIGRLSDATGERRKFVSGLVALGAVGFFCAGIFADHTTFLIVALSLLGAGIIASIPTFWTLPPKLLAGAGAGAAGGIAVINTLGQFGGIVSPVMVGRIKDLTGSTTPALYVIGVCALLAAALLLWGLPQKLRTLDKR